MPIQESRGLGALNDRVRSTPSRASSAVVCTGRWTNEEDERLKKAVTDVLADSGFQLDDHAGGNNANVGPENLPTINWVDVAKFVETRSRQQCLHRWNKSVCPFLKRGKFSSKEDELLVAAVEKHGTGNWRLVKGEVPGRSDVQCRERYLNSLQPGLKIREPWTTQESAKLMDLVNLHGEKWSRIAPEMDGRTDYMCRKQWKKLMREQS